MKTLITAVLAAMLVIPVRAEEKAAPAKSSWSDFFKNLKSSLAQSAVSGERKKGRGAVAAVRGAGQAKKNIADPNEPGLKGDSRSAKAKKELGYDMELEAAIDQLAEGKLDEGLRGLEKFKAAHPKHHAEDVDRAIEGAKAMIAERAGGTPATSTAATKE